MEALRDRPRLWYFGARVDDAGQTFVIAQTAGAPLGLPVGSGDVRVEFQMQKEEPGEGLLLLKMHGPACHIWNVTEYLNSFALIYPGP